MDRFVLQFLRASLAWLAAGMLFGFAMAVHPAWTAYRPVHVHLLVLGFVTMMIAGVAYHVFPHFVATPLHSATLARWHFALANAGLVLMTAGFVARLQWPPGATPLLGAGALLTLAGTGAFIWNLWRTLDHAVVVPPRPAPARPLPVMAPPAAS